MRLNALGESCGGVGTTDLWVCGPSLSDQPQVFARGGGTCWLDEIMLACDAAVGFAVCEYDRTALVPRIVDDVFDAQGRRIGRGANWLRAGGGAWAASLVTSAGVRTRGKQADGSDWPSEYFDWTIDSIGRDGTAVFLKNGALAVVCPDGTRDLLPPADSIRIGDDGALTCVRQGHVTWLHPGSPDDATIETVSGVAVYDALVVAGWVIYATDDGRVLVHRRDDPTQGYPFRVSAAFSLDAVMVGPDRLLIAWMTGQAERPNELERHVLQLGVGMVPLTPGQYPQVVSHGVYQLFYEGRGNPWPTVDPRTLPWGHVITSGIGIDEANRWGLGVVTGCDEIHRALRPVAITVRNDGGDGRDLDAEIRRARPVSEHENIALSVYIDRRDPSLEWPSELRPYDVVGWPCFRNKGEPLEDFYQSCRRACLYARSKRQLFIALATQAFDRNDPDYPINEAIEAQSIWPRLVREFPEIIALEDFAYGRHGLVSDRPIGGIVVHPELLDAIRASVAMTPDGPARWPKPNDYRVTVPVEPPPQHPPTVDPPADEDDMSDTLQPGQVLKRGEELRSKNGEFRAVLQDDGNFVGSTKDGRVLWGSSTEGTATAEIIMQADGNLVFKDAAGHVIRGSHTEGKPGCFVKLTNDGRLAFVAPVQFWGDPQPGF